MNRLKATVVGATGLVGGHLVKQLVDAEHIGSVTTVTRRPDEYSSQKLTNCVVDFSNLSQYRDAFNADALFLCLGTTRQQAGSIAAQRLVDFDYQYQAAKLGFEQGVQHLILVSSSGAKASSLSPYLKMKGELEQAIGDLNFQYTSILQPSLLLGQRSESRLAEGLASAMMPTLCRLPILSRYRPIHGAQVAQKMVELSKAPSQKLTVLTLDRVFPSD